MLPKSSGNIERREAADTPAKYGQAVPEHCGLASSGCDPDAHAEMPNVSGSICCGLDRGRTFTPGRSQFAFVAAGPLRGRAALPGSKIFVPPRYCENGIR